MKRLFVFLSLVLIAAALGACTTPTPEVIEKEVEVTRIVNETVVETVVETVIVPETVEVEKVVTATPEPAPTGGTFVWALQIEPPSLDPLSETWHTMTDLVLEYIGSTLVAVEPGTGEVVPYLAESWTISDDGLTYDFVLRKDVKFHDGTPLTAQDYAWTFNKIAAPDSVAAAKYSVPTLASAEALDDYTLRLTLSSPYYPMLKNLSSSRFQPLSQAAYETVGADQFARQPIGVGPFIFKEWLTGEKIVLERNPDYAWSPSFLEKGGPYIDTLEIRIVPEYATALAGLETGEFDYYYMLQAQDVQRMKDTGNLEVMQAPMMGMCPEVDWDASVPPLDDVRVRQALYLATDRDVLVQVVALGMGEPQYGPVSSSVNGYWDGVKDLGVTYDLEKAKALMAEAGYTTNSDGMLEKDGQPLKLTMQTNSVDSFVKTSQVLQEQWRKLGVELELQQVESGILVGNWYSRDFQTILMCAQGPDFDYNLESFLTQDGGGVDITKTGTPEFDELLLSTRSIVDPAARQEKVIEATTYIVENALNVPLYAAMQFDALSTRVQGAVFSDKSTTRQLWLDNATIVE